MVVLILMCADAGHTLASEIIMPAEAVQGSTIVIEIPAEDITQISGKLDGHDLIFYKTERKPRDEEQITRAEFLELMFLNNDFAETGVPRLAHAEDSSPFPDVDISNPYFEYILKAKKLGIVSGYEDGNFYPYALITRGQAAKMLVEAFKPESVIMPSIAETASIAETPSTAVTTDLFATEPLSAAEKTVESPLFPDVPADHVFYNYIGSSVESQWFKGYPDGLMRPDRNINFLEAGIVVKRAAVPEFFTDGGEKSYYKAYAGIHRLTQPGPKTLEITKVSPIYGTNTYTKEINVLHRPVKTVSFYLSQDKTDLFGDDAQDKTWAAVDAARGNPTGEQLWEGPFQLPAVGVITLGFGDVLYINGNYSGSHFGIDYANDGGTPVHAANSGRVTLAEYTPAFGNTVVIDHGLNVFSMYLHMSELKVLKNDMVEKGDLIGLMGSTGISSGDHLHYTQFIGDVIVDSDPWINGFPQ